MSEKVNNLYSEWAGHEHTQDYECNIYDSAQMLGFAEYCIEAELAETHAEIRAFKDSYVAAVDIASDKDAIIKQMLEPMKGFVAMFTDTKKYPDQETVVTGLRIVFPRMQAAIEAAKGGK